MKFYSYFLEHQLKTLSVNTKKLSESDFAALEVKVQMNCSEFCEEKFFIPANLDLHVKRNHRRVFKHEPLKCLFCVKFIRGKSNLSRHIQLFHKNEGVPCRYKGCFQVFTTEKNLDDHLQNKHHLFKGKSPNECKKCKYWFQSKKNLKLHEKIHAREEIVERPKTIECIFCPDLFSNKFDLNSHTKEKHWREAIRCPRIHCMVFFKTRKQMREHFESTHRNSCKFCHATFSSRTFLFTHFRQVHLDKKCKSSRCAFFSGCKEEMETHVEQKHEKKLLECVYCGKGLIGRINLNDHVRRIHSNISIRCDFPTCWLYVKSREALEEHKKEAHKKVERRRKAIACIFCQKTCTGNVSYAHHIKSCHSDEALRCKYKWCPTYFKSELDLQEHHKEKHEEKYNCALCDYISYKRDNMELHFQQHHFPKDKKCPHCPKMYGNLKYLRNHVNYAHKPDEKCPHCLQIKKHLNSHVVTADCPACSQPFPCSKLLSDHKLKCKKVHECRECRKKFNHSSNFKYHMYNKHKFGKKWKGYKCKFCEAHFKNTKSVRNHLKSEHSELTKFKCDLCQERFFCSISMRRHFFHKHKFGGVKCKFCSKLFLGKNELSEHLLHKHMYQFVECDDCGQIMKKTNLANHFIHQHLNRVKES